MSYTKNTWITGDVVTSSKLNNMESGIDAAVNRLVITLTYNDGEEAGVGDKTWSEIQAAWEQGREIIINDDGYMCPFASYNTSGTLTWVFYHPVGNVLVHGTITANDDDPVTFEVGY